MKLRHFASFALSLAVAGSLSAQERLIPKQLAGPIDEVRTGVMAKADPIDTAVHSKSALVPVQLQPTKAGEWTWQGEVAADGDNLRVVLFSGEESWDLSMADGETRRLKSARGLATSLERSSVDMGNSFEGDYYQFAQRGPGTWPVEISAKAPHSDRGFLLFASDSPYRLLSYKATYEQLVGREIGFVAYGYEKQLEGLQTLNLGMVEQASLRVTTPAGEDVILPMFDDGRHGDGKAGDGKFGGSFVARLEGEYLAQVTVRGTTPDGSPFVRSAQHLVPVIAPRLELMRDFAIARVADSRLEIDLAVDNSVGAPEKYRAFAEVWGADALGEMQPISWIGGMSYVDNGRLSLGLDLRWLGQSPARGSFELRNLRIEDADHFIAVVKAERMPLSVPRLPEAAYVAPKSSDEAMYMGPRPSSMGPTKAGSRLLLVHGYCSGNVWGPVAGQFSNDSVFLDTNQNRSHDQFANLIASFGSGYSSYGIVAHSQGGAAALHLYTYYWSGLDYASGGRLIQSVGTPYQGTALAGNAAVLGQIFGVGCGTNSDLTYSGASSWLSGVPTWARNAVNYYTTSFTDKWWRYDYCHIVTDLLLSDPDDGTTEKAKGQLSSGINRGHRTGWCHTDGMRDPNQTRDSSRNSSMNSNAAN